MTRALWPLGRQTTSMRGQKTGRQWNKAYEFVVGSSATTISPCCRRFNLTDIPSVLRPEMHQTTSIDRTGRKRVLVHQQNAIRALQTLTRTVQLLRLPQRSAACSFRCTTHCEKHDTINWVTGSRYRCRIVENGKSKKKEQQQQEILAGTPGAHVPQRLPADGEVCSTPQRSRRQQS